MKTYTGSCHCGAIRFAFTAPPIRQGLRCTCSLCRRKGAPMSDFIAPEDMRIDAAAGDLAVYTFGSGVARHFFCRCCGIYPFHQGRRKPGHYRVNLGCVDGLDALSLPVEVFDGASL